MRTHSPLCLAGILWLFELVCPAAVSLADAPLQASLTIRADWFERGNVRASQLGQAYADKYACIWNAGTVPNQSEYDIDFPVTAEYEFLGLYAAASSRPVEIHLDGQKMHTGFASVTGSWQTSSADGSHNASCTSRKASTRSNCFAPGPACRISVPFVWNRRSLSRTAGNSTGPRHAATCKTLPSGPRQAI